MSDVDEKEWSKLSLEEKLEALGFEDGTNDERMHAALDAFSETLVVVEELEELVKAAEADPAEMKNVFEQISNLLREE